jgi:hypothetical protein
MTKPTAAELVRHAEQILNEWLADNTEAVFEEQPEIDAARDLLLDALELLA